MDTPNSAPFPTLEGHKNVNLTTFRRGGEAVVTPVWFVVLDGNIYMRTGADSGKVKRIRNNPRVLLAPSTVMGRPVGPTTGARARILGPQEAGLAGTAVRLLRRRYRTTPIVDLFIGREEHVVLEIAPVQV